MPSLELTTRLTTTPSRPGSASRYLTSTRGCTTQLNPDGCRIISLSLLQESLPIRTWDIVEGNSGTTHLVSAVSRRVDTSQPLTLDWATEDDTATASTGDYVAASVDFESKKSGAEKSLTASVIVPVALQIGRKLDPPAISTTGSESDESELSLAILSNDDEDFHPDALFADLNGSLLDELLAV